MKRHITDIILIIVLLAGISLLLYPTVSEYVNSKHQSKVIHSYNDQVEKMDEDSFKKWFDEADDYNRRLNETAGAFYKPQKVSGYEDTLNFIGDGVIGYVSIDKINVELPIYHSTEPEVLQFAAGHLEGTSLPVGGEGTHSVLVAHRGLPSARLFTDLDELETGDIFTITVLNRVMTYEIDQILTVLPEEVKELQTQEGKDFCTLLTCTPYGINTHRLLVRGKRIENSEEKEALIVVNEAFKVDPLIVAPVVAAPMILIFVIVVIFSGRGKKKLRKEGVKKNES